MMSSYPSQIQQDEWLSLIPHIIHDFRTPLLTIRMENDLLEKWFPELLKGYRLAVENGLMEGKLKEKQLVMHEQTGSNIGNLINKLFGFLQVLEDGTQALKTESISNPSHSIQFYIDHLLTHYPFESETDRQRVKLTWESDFKLCCPGFFIESLLWLLFEMAYDIIKTVKDAEITIGTEIKKQHHQLYIKTAHQDFQDNRVDYAFKRAFAQKENNYIPGLGFCQLALRKMQGDLIAQVSKDEMAFIVSFPQ